MSTFFFFWQSCLRQLRWASTQAKNHLKFTWITAVFKRIFIKRIKNLYGEKLLLLLCDVRIVPLFCVMFCSTDGRLRTVTFLHHCKKANSVNEQFKLKKCCVVCCCVTRVWRTSLGSDVMCSLTSRQKLERPRETVDGSAWRLEIQKPLENIRLWLFSCSVFMTFFHDFCCALTKGPRVKTQQTVDSPPKTGDCRSGKPSKLPTDGEVQIFKFGLKLSVGGPEKRISIWLFQNGEMKQQQVEFKESNLESKLLSLNRKVSSTCWSHFTHPSGKELIRKHFWKVKAKLTEQMFFFPLSHL